MDRVQQLVSRRYGPPLLLQYLSLTRLIDGSPQGKIYAAFPGPVVRYWYWTLFTRWGDFLFLTRDEKNGRIRLAPGTQLSGYGRRRFGFQVGLLGLFDSTWRRALWEWIELFWGGALKI